MVIDINNNFANSTSAANRNRAGSQVADRESTRQTPAAAQPSARDQVVLSEQAQGLQKLQASLNDLPEVDSDRVKAIRQAIAEGKFEINAERIAENLLKQDDLLR